MELKKNHIDFNSYYNNIGYESNQINNKTKFFNEANVINVEKYNNNNNQNNKNNNNNNNNIIDNNIYFSNEINLDKDNKDIIRMKNNNITNNINENELFNLTKDNFYKTASPFFNKDYLKSNTMDNKVDIIPNSNRNINNGLYNIHSFSSYSNSDKNTKYEIDKKYHYYLSNLNNEKNNENNNTQYNTNFVKDNEQIQKLLEEEKNIEDENLKRLNELRTKYLSSIKTFDITKEVKNNTHNINPLRELKARTERSNIVQNNNININSNNNNSSLSLLNNNNLLKQTNSMNDIIKAPNDLSYNNKSSLVLNHEQSLSQYTFKDNIFNVLTPKQKGIDSTINIINYNNDINYFSKSQNQSLRKHENFLSQSLKDDFEKIEMKEEKSIENQNQNNMNKNEKILNDAKINMSIYESNTKDKNNNSQFYNVRNNMNQDFYFKYDDSIDEKKKIMEKNKSVDYIRTSKVNNIFGNKEINNTNRNEKINNNEIFTENKNKNEEIYNKNEIISKNINENKYFNKSINNDNNLKNISIDKKENYNNDFMNDYQNLKDNYNQLKLEYNSLKNEHIKLLEEYNKDKKNTREEKTLFNEYIMKENNDLRAINSNYEYILTPLIHYINDINYHYNKKNLKKLNILKIKENIRNTNIDYNHIEENSLYSLVLLLDNYKNIIINGDSNKSLFNRSKSNLKKISTYESIMKNYNIKNNIFFKSTSNKSGDKNKNIKSLASIAVAVTPIYSKKMKSKLFGNENKINKTEKIHIQKNYKSKDTEKRKQIKDKILKKENSSGKRKKYSHN